MFMKEYSEKLTFGVALRNLLKAVFSPHESIGDAETRSKSILLSVSLCGIAFIVALYELVTSLFNGYEFSLPSAIGYSLLLVAYLFNVSGRFRIGALLFIFTIPVVEFVKFFLEPETFDFINIVFIGLNVIFCALFFSIGLTLFVAILNIAGIILTALWITRIDSSFPFKTIIDPLFVHIGTGTLLIGLFLYLKKTFEEQQKRLVLNKVRYRNLFEESPIAVWEINASGLKSYLDGLKSRGVENLEGYLEEKPYELVSSSAFIRVVDVNNTAVKLFEARDKKDLIANLDKLLQEAWLPVFRKSVYRRLEGSLLNVYEIDHRSLTGKKLRLLVHSSLPEEFKDSWERIIISVIDITERKEMETQLRQRANFMELVSGIQNSISSVLDLNELLGRAVESLKKNLGFFENSIWLRDGNELVLHATSFDEMQEKIGKVRLRIGSEGIIGKTGELKELYNCPDVTTDPYYRVFVEGVKTRSECAVPIMIKDRLIGVLDIQSEKESAFSHEDEKILLTVAGQLAIAIENASLYENARKRLERLTTINRIGREISTSLEIDTLLETAYSEIVTIFEPDALAIGFYNEETNTFDCKICIDKGIRIKSFPLNLNRDPAPLLKLVVEERKPIRFTNFSEERFKFPRLHLWGTGEIPDSWLGVPLIKNGSIIGMIVLQSYRKNAYSKEDEAFLSTIADQLTVALDNARLYEQVKRELEREKLLEAQLVQAQKMEAIGRLAGGIAHDFNNILTGILGYTDLLIEGHEGEDWVKELLEIKKAAKRAAMLTSQLLAFGRKQVLRMRVVDLKETIEDLKDMLDRVIGEDVELQIEGEPDCLVKVDPGQVSQVVLNLAVNARDAMPEGGSLLIKTEKLELNGQFTEGTFNLDPGSYVVLTVRDTGTGMNDETVSHIFEPFFTTKEIGKGTGLGLSMVYGIVKQSNGDILVRSKIGEGTEFRIYFPYAEEQISTAISPAGDVETGSHEGRTKTPDGHGETILLVEDEEAVRNITARILSSAGYSVLLAGDAGEAIEICNRHLGKISLLISDIIMPGGMSGKELAEYLQSIHPEIKIMFISGYSEETVTNNKALKEGVEFLQKPFTSHDLAEKVHRLLGG